MISSHDFQQLKFDTLKHFWGYDTFRDSQENIINSVIEGRDSLALLPTGGGKSLCYQLPALVLEGTCIVVSPLLALMKDQVYQLKNNGIEAEYLSSELDEFDAETVYNRCKDGLTKLLYVSPERLTNRVFLQNLEEIQISFIAVDEAHCISEWGQDFRPSYQNIKDFRSQFLDIPCLALTATATPKVLQEIKLKLNLKNPEIFKKSFRRTNIKIISDKISDKYQRILNLMKYNTSSGIIYVRTRKESEELVKFLQNNSINNVDFFHAGLPVKEKNARQNHWLKSNDHVLISTNAFGMGIDKDNVRFVVHFSPPQSLENYYQEIGRVGRDGQPSSAFLFWNEQELTNFDQILRNQTPTKHEFYNIVSYLYSGFQIAENDLAENVFQLHIQKIQNFTKASLAKIRNVLGFLHNQEIVFFNSNRSLSSLELKINPDELDLLAKKDAYFIELLLRTYSGLTTHKIMFSEFTLSNKMNVDSHLIKERIKELQQKNYVEYIDGALASIKFLKHRDDRAVQGKYWCLFEQIQKNKLQKWEEMKFFVRNSDFCKMKLILSYFGEKEVKNCGNCSVCEQQKESVFGRNVSQEIIEILKQKPSNVEEIAIRLNYYEKENILENLIYLLDSGKVKMLNFRTYAYNHE
ncbi:RecQ family ATP-dependent DNA helicase [Kaistella faecalis]|uniref:RecQ family ATP-dependent DNA helicase n=1 Tax=Kaistella faecalis TaxID=2852098 RepID=UPI001C46D1CA|nr:ATP-dependent DNA helicase RecQ [Chryseobacterium faecale]UFK98576.1 RecQ family ATP-dependent DNA helicase [Chryseobacterium faecale]